MKKTTTYETDNKIFDKRKGIQVHGTQLPLGVIGVYTRTCILDRLDIKKRTMVSPTKNLKLRGAEPTGNGWYGADRSGGRKHKGLDIVAGPGERIFSPITGKIVRVGTVYSFTRKFKLLVIANDVYEVKIMYLDPHPFNPGDLVSECTEIGKNQDISRYWGGGMVNHIHFEVRKHGLLTDPEPLLVKPDWL